MLLVLLCALVASAPQERPRTEAQSAAAAYQQGIAAEKANDLNAARAAYENAIQIDPSMAVAQDRLGFVLGRLGRTPEAVAAFEQAVRLKPDLFDAQYHLGATRWWTKDIDGALVALEAAVRLQPGHAEARYYLGLTLKQKGRLGEAIVQLREAARIGPSLAPIHLQLGVALQDAGDFDGAIASLRTAARVDPSSVEIAEQPRACADAGRRAADEAISTFRALAERQPGKMTARINLGSALMQRGDLASAVSVLKDGDAITACQRRSQIQPRAGAQAAG